MATPITAVATSIATAQAAEQAYVNALVKGGATPQQLYEAGHRRGYGLACREDGHVEAVAMIAANQTA